MIRTLMTGLLVLAVSLGSATSTLRAEETDEKAAAAAKKDDQQQVEKTPVIRVNPVSNTATRSGVQAGELAVVRADGTVRPASVRVNPSLYAGDGNGETSVATNTNLIIYTVNGVPFTTHGVGLNLRVNTQPTETVNTENPEVYVPANDDPVPATPWDPSAPPITSTPGGGSAPPATININNTNYGYNEGQQQGSPGATATDTQHAWPGDVQRQLTDAESLLLLQRGDKPYPYKRFRTADDEQGAQNDAIGRLLDFANGGGLNTGLPPAGDPAPWDGGPRNKPNWPNGLGGDPGASNPVDSDEDDTGAPADPPVVADSGTRVDVPVGGGDPPTVPDDPPPGDDEQDGGGWTISGPDLPVLGPDDVPDLPNPLDWIDLPDLGDLLDDLPDIFDDDDDTGTGGGETDTGGGGTGTGGGGTNTGGGGTDTGDTGNGDDTGPTGGGGTDIDGGQDTGGTGTGNGGSGDGDGSDDDGPRGPDDPAIADGGGRQVYSTTRRPHCVYDLSSRDYEEYFDIDTSNLHSRVIEHATNVLESQISDEWRRARSDRSWEEQTTNSGFNIGSEVGNSTDDSKASANANYGQQNNGGDSSSEESGRTEASTFKDTTTASYTLIEVEVYGWVKIRKRYRFTQAMVPCEHCPPEITPYTSEYEMTGDWDTHEITPIRYKSIIAGSPRNSKVEQQQRVEAAVKREALRRTDARARNSVAFPEPPEPLHLPSPMTME